MLMQVLANGLMLSLIYALVSIGLTMIYGVMHILNWAHGEIVMLGAMGAYFFFAATGMPFAASLVITVILVGLLSVLIERIVFKPMRGLHLPSFIMSMGLVYVLQAFATVTVGVQDKMLPSVLTGAVNLFGAILPKERVMLMPIAAALTVGYYLFLEKTRYGRAIRATSMDEVGAALQGISVDRCAAIAMGTGSALAAAAGCLLAPIVKVTPFMGEALVFKAFIIVFVGGRMSLVGTILAAFLLGYTESLVAGYWDPVWIPMIEMAVLAAVLLFRPGGLVGVEIKKLGAERE